ncbi:Hypothetical predicted protein, partial [Pelobates cultripes]
IDFSLIGTRFLTELDFSLSYPSEGTRFITDLTRAEDVLPAMIEAFLTLLDRGSQSSCLTYVICATILVFKSFSELFQVSVVPSHRTGDTFNNPPAEGRISDGHAEDELIWKDVGICYCGFTPLNCQSIRTLAHVTILDSTYPKRSRSRRSLGGRHSELNTFPHFHHLPVTENLCICQERSKESNSNKS